MKKPSLKPKVQTIRRGLGLNQRELALLLGVHEMTVSKWERGELVPNEYQRTLLVAFKQGHEKHRNRDLKVWIANQGWTETLAMVLASAYGFGPESRWTRV